MSRARVSLGTGEAAAGRTPVSRWAALSGGIWRSREPTSPADVIPGFLWKPKTLGGIQVDPTGLSGGQSVPPGQPLPPFLHWRRPGTQGSLSHQASQHRGLHPQSPEFPAARLPRPTRQTLLSRPPVQTSACTPLPGLLVQTQVPTPICFDHLSRLTAQTHLRDPPTQPHWPPCSVVSGQHKICKWQLGPRVGTPSLLSPMTLRDRMWACPNRGQWISSLVFSCLFSCPLLAADQNVLRTQHPAWVLGKPVTFSRPLRRPAAPWAGQPPRARWEGPEVI